MQCSFLLACKADHNALVSKKILIFLAADCFSSQSTITNVAEPGGLNVCHALLSLQHVLHQPACASAWGRSPGTTRGGSHRHHQGPSAGTDLSSGHRRLQKQLTQLRGHLTEPNLSLHVTKSSFPGIIWDTHWCSVQFASPAHGSWGSKFASKSQFTVSGYF